MSLDRAARRRRTRSGATRRGERGSRRARCGSRPKGRAFYDLLAVVWRFGNGWLWLEGERPPLQLVDRDSGEPVVPRVIGETTGDPIDVGRLKIKLAHPSRGRTPRPAPA